MDNLKVDGKTAAGAIMFIIDLILHTSELKFGVPTDVPF